MIDNEQVIEISWKLESDIALFQDEAFWKKVPKSLFYRNLPKKPIWLESYMELEKKVCSSYAASLLVKRSYTSHMLASKLTEKRFEPSSIEHAIQLLEKYGYLNDEKRVIASIEKYVRSGYGPAYIQAKLQQTLKLSYEEARFAVHDHCTYDLIDHALEIAVSKVKQKTYAALYRRGFSSDQINSVL